MPVTYKLGKIFDKAALTRAASKAVEKSAKEFAAYVPEQQVRSTHSGRTYKRKSGKGFTRSHRASAKGERPAPDTFKLTKGTKAKMTGTLRAEVTTVAKNGSFDYASQLENKMGRHIQNAPEDLRKAQELLDKNGALELSKL